MVPKFTDHSANERTYLAWVRTAIAIMAFGFLLERFDIFLSYASHAYVSRAGEQSLPALHVRASEWLGLVLLLFGAFVVLLATVCFYRNRKLIDSADIAVYGTSVLERLLSGSLILMAVFLVIYVAREILALG
jgi:putative membrane protein